MIEPQDQIETNFTTEAISVKTIPKNASLASSSEVPHSSELKEGPSTTETPKGGEGDCEIEHENALVRMVLPMIPALTSIFESYELIDEDGTSKQLEENGQTETDTETGTNEHGSNNKDHQPRMTFPLLTNAAPFLPKILAETSALLFKDLGGEQFDEEEDKINREVKISVEERQRRRIPTFVTAHHGQYDGNDSQQSILTELTFHDHQEKPSPSCSATSTVRKEAYGKSSKKSSSFMGSFAETSAELVKNRANALLRTLSVEEYDEEADEEAKMQIWRERQRQRTRIENNETLKMKDTKPIQKEALESTGTTTRADNENDFLGSVGPEN